MGTAERELQISKKARYYTYGHDITRARYIWLACHGYGQLGKFFINNFRSLDPDLHFVVAPEGLHRFYLEGFSGRVGASWMTKEARLDDISDYVNYLDSVLHHCGASAKKPGQHIVAFGFSQGVATISRWVALGSHRPDIAVFWAGTFPPDLEPIRSTNAFQNIQTICTSGDDDPFITVENIQETQRQLLALKIDPLWFRFPGAHVITPPALQDVVNLFV